MARKRRKRNGNDRLTGIVLGVVGVALLMSLGLGAWWVKGSKTQLDAENCPITGPKAIHVIMIDRSDPISGQQAQRIKQYIQKARDTASFGTRFDVYTFEGDFRNEFRPIVRVCAPGRPSEANELIENPEMIRRRYDELFSAVLDKSVNSLIGERNRDNSPILESLRGAAITSFGGIDSSKVSTRATLISDMVQHSASVSHFRATPDFPTLAKTAVWPQLLPHLNGATVEILYLLRPGAARAGAPIQNRGHQLFWEQLIAASNGRLLTIEPI